VRFPHLMATVVAGSGLVWAILAFAQGPGGAPPQSAAAATNKTYTSVAVVDVKYIFDHLVGFKSAMERIKQENDAFEAQVREKETVVRKQIEELKGLTPGSDAYKRLEEHISHTRTQVQLDITRRQKQRMEDEAKLYHRAYQEVEKSIASFAQRYRIDLVLQHSTAEIDPSKPDTVIRGLNRLVLYQDRLNISDYILDELNRAAPAAPSAGATQPNRQGAVPRTGQAPPAPTGPVRK
jgi:Skp family chaperone for outer membrane proteins